eukprot:15443690-Alexandrium_andersonii.AAC.1
MCIRDRGRLPSSKKSVKAPQEGVQGRSSPWVALRSSSSIERYSLGWSRGEVEKGGHDRGWIDQRPALVR